MSKFLILFLVLNQLILAGAGSIDFVGGKAYILRGNRLIQASAGLSLMPGDRLRIEKNSNISFRLKGIGRLRVSKETTFLIPKPATEKMNQVGHLKLWAGSIWCEVRKMITGLKFEIQTPTATAGVRGTSFEVQYIPTENITRTFVEEGEVVTRDLKGRILKLSAGNYSSIGPGIFERKKDLELIKKRKIHFLRIPDSTGSDARNNAMQRATELEKSLKSSLPQKKEDRGLGQFLRNRSNSGQENHEKFKKEGRRSFKTGMKQNFKETKNLEKARNNSFMYGSTPARFFARETNRRELSADQYRSLYKTREKMNSIEKLDRFRGRNELYRRNEKLREKLKDNPKWRRENIKRFLDEERTDNTKRLPNLKELNRLKKLQQNRSNFFRTGTIRESSVHSDIEQNARTKAGLKNADSVKRNYGKIKLEKRKSR